METCGRRSRQACNRRTGGKSALRWQKVEEVKGLGMRGETKEGDIYWAGSYKVAANLTSDATHNVYIVCNHRLLGYIDVKDTLVRKRPVLSPGYTEKAYIPSCSAETGNRPARKSPLPWESRKCWPNRHLNRSWSR